VVFDTFLLVDIIPVSFNLSVLGQLPRVFQTLKDLGMVQRNKVKQFLFDFIGIFNLGH